MVHGLFRLGRGVTRGGLKLFQSGSRIFKGGTRGAKFVKGTIAAGTGTTILGISGLGASTLIEKSSAKLSAGLGAVGLGGAVATRRAEFEVESDIQDLRERSAEFNQDLFERQIGFYESLGIDTTTLISKGAGHPTNERAGGGFEFTPSSINRQLTGKKGGNVLLPLLVIFGVGTAVVLATKKKRKK